MAEFVQNLDPSKLVVAETVLSFVTVAFTAPPYNFPLFLFGLYAQENGEANQSLRIFTGLLGGSVVLDIVWLSTNGQNWFLKLVSVIVLVLKAPTFFAFATALRQRGDQFSGLGGLGIRGDNLSGPTVWSMPGGFSSSLGGAGRDGYTEVGGGGEAAQLPPNPQPHFTPQPPTQSTSPTPGTYQSV